MAEQVVQGLILLGLSAALDFFVAARFLPALPPGALTGGVFVLVAAGAALLPGAWYRRWRYAVTEEALFAERGLLTRVRTVVPLGRIQHLDVRDGVVERALGLSRLVVHTAGTHNYSVVVPGLQRAHAEHLRDRIRTLLADRDAP